MSRVTHALLLLSALSLASCQLKITAKTARDPGGPGGSLPPSGDPPIHTPGDPPLGEPGLRAVSGDGQVTVTRFAFADPLAVSFAGADGHVIPGATVTWKSSDTQGALNFTQTTSVTDGSGVASLAVTAGSIGATESGRSVTVTASTTASGKTFTRVFHETVALTTPRAFFLKSAPVYSVPASSTLKEALKVSVVAVSGDQAGHPVPGVALRVTPIVPEGTDPSQVPNVGCAGGTVLTDANGEATCDLVAGAQTGSVQISVSVGRFVTYTRSSAQVTH